MDITQFKEALAGLENGEELLKVFSDHDSSLREEAKSYRLAKGSEKVKSTELEENLKDILNSLKATNKEEAVSKITDSDTRIKELSEKLVKLEEAFGNEQKEKEQVKKEEEEALLISEITSAISSKKVSDKNGIIKDAMLKRATKNDSGQWLIGEQTPEEFLQGQIDSEEPMFKTKSTLEKPPKTGDVYSIDELEGLTREEYKENKEKVERSKKALLSTN